MLKTSEKAESGIDDYQFRVDVLGRKPKYKENGGRLNKIEKRFEMKIEDKVLQTCCF